MREDRPPQGSVARAPVVLLVEDDDSNREMYAVYLESEGYWVLSARNGAEGLVNARNFRPELVVTDLSMPGMDGWELARALREDDRTSAIHIIALSGRPRDEETDRHLQQQHVDRVLTKPCLPDELLREMRSVLARDRVERVRAGEHFATTDHVVRPSRDRSNERARRASRLQRGRR